MRLARRILPFAACVVIVVAGLAVPQIRQKIPQKPQKPGEEKPAVEGVYAPQEVASAEKLTDAVGFPVRDIASLKEKATDRSYVTYGDGLAEITYRWDSQSICFRQSQGQEDNSGDYTHYAEEKLIVVGKYSVFQRTGKRQLYACNLVGRHIFFLCICHAGIEKSRVSGAY